MCYNYFLSLLFFITFLRTKLKPVGTDFTFIFIVVSSNTCPLFLNCVFIHWSKSSGSSL
ncbi:Elongation factor 2 [Labeo rohita]|uniref:Elongation factor 2 n=1 Tax=Labeo rohita TaxID=84645 RepID=A0ABQ8M5G5_LABRO|nr:Elongation factor 2 [Labeo rohita]